jgi:hypothetical protein
VTAGASSDAIAAAVVLPTPFAATMTSPDPGGNLVNRRRVGEPEVGGSRMIALASGLIRGEARAATQSHGVALQKGGPASVSATPWALASAARLAGPWPAPMGHHTLIRNTPFTKLLVGDSQCSQFGTGTCSFGQCRSLWAGAKITVVRVASASGYRIQIGCLLSNPARDRRGSSVRVVVEESVHAAGSFTDAGVSAGSGVKDNVIKGLCGSGKSVNASNAAISGTGP